MPRGSWVVQSVKRLILVLVQVMISGCEIEPQIKLCSVQSLLGIFSPSLSVPSACTFSNKSLKKKVMLKSIFREYLNCSLFIREGRVAEEEGKKI